MSEPVLTKLELIEGYKFRVKFDEDLPILLVDEMKPIGDGVGPNPSRLLSTAVGHCLSSSLIYCLKKARVSIKKLDTSVAASIERNKEGYLRVTGLNVKIQLEVADEDKLKIPRCLAIFENYCTVTQSVRQAINVKVDINQL